MNQELSDAIKSVSAAHDWNPLDLATVMSYETGGTFNPWQLGPTTASGQHIGLIQWGAPERAKYGITKAMPIAQQVAAVGQFLTDRGVKNGDGILPIYAAINAGNAKNIHASDADNGGAPGTVLDKVMTQMGDHRANAARMLDVADSPITMKLPPLPTATSTPQQDAQRDEAYEMATLPPKPDMSNENAINAPTEEPNYPSLTPITPDKPGPSLWDIQSAAFDSESSLPYIAKKLWTPQEAPDPNWQLDDNRLQSDLKERGIPLDFYAQHYTPHSEANYQQTLSDAQTYVKNQQTLAEAGGLGTFASIANAILDPVQLGADAVMASVVPEAVVAQRASQLGRIAASVGRGAAIGAGGAYLSGKVADAVNPNRDALDTLYGTVFGLAGGATFGLGSGLIHGVPATLAAREITHGEGQMIQQAARNSVDAYARDMNPGLSGSVGAARNPVPETFVKDEALDALSPEDFAKTAFAKVRLDLSAQLQKSEGSTTTRALSGLVLDSVGKVDKGVVNQHSASEMQGLLFDQASTSAACGATIKLRA